MDPIHFMTTEELKAELHDMVWGVDFGIFDADVNSRYRRLTRELESRRRAALEDAATPKFLSGYVDSFAA